MPRKTGDLVTVHNLIVPAFAAAASSRLRLRPPFIDFPTPHEVALFPELRQSIVHFLSAETGLARKHWPKLIRRAFPELKDDPLEDMLAKLVVRCYIIRHYLCEEKPFGLHDFIEFCAGQGNLTLECCSARSTTFEATACVG